MNNDIKKEIFDKFYKLSKLLPEQRVGQLFFNYIAVYCKGNDTFHLTDKKMLEYLNRTIEDIERKRQERQLREWCKDPEFVKNIFEMAKKLGLSIDNNE